MKKILHANAGNENQGIVRYASKPRQEARALDRPPHKAATKFLVPAKSDGFCGCEDPTTQGPSWGWVKPDHPSRQAMACWFKHSTVSRTSYRKIESFFSHESIHMSRCMSSFSRPQAWKPTSLTTSSSYKKKFSRSLSSTKDTGLELVRNVGIMAVRKKKTCICRLEIPGRRKPGELLYALCITLWPHDAFLWLADGKYAIHGDGNACNKGHEALHAESYACSTLTRGRQQCPSVCFSFRTSWGRWDAHICNFSEFLLVTDLLAYTVWGGAWGRHSHGFHGPRKRAWHHDQCSSDLI